jgi:hypothetical protein
MGLTSPLGQYQEIRFSFPISFYRRRVLSGAVRNCTIDSHGTSQYKKVS